ncbi:MAG: hypothetical protein CJBNEKGG_01659 [Prosthecobacter sp.]|nr:hypothetical protein [Prosthecobacter sp.]
MKPTNRLHLLCLSLLASLSFAHEGVELGPNGGRILEFSKNETLHGELTVKDDRFHIALLDKDMKPLALAEQKLTATTGDREAPRKLEVGRDARGFVLPSVKPGEWLILQFRNSPDEKAVTARFEYNTATCEECQSPEWICKCRPEAAKK